MWGKSRDNYLLDEVLVKFHHATDKAQNTGFHSFKKP